MLDETFDLLLEKKSVVVCGEELEALINIFQCLFVLLELFFG